MKPAALLIHGIWDTAKVFRRIHRALEAAGVEVYTPSLENNYGEKGIENLAEQVASIMEECFPERDDVSLVGFSMGGIVSRYYLQELGGRARVQRLITLSSPHKGTITGYAYPTKAAQQMAYRSRFIKQLESNDHLLEGMEIHSFWTPFDVMIIPFTSSQWKLARGKQFYAIAHPFMLIDDSVINDVVELIAHK